MCGHLAATSRISFYKLAPLIGAFFILLTTNLQAAPPSLDNLATHPYWHQLLYYKKDFVGNFKSLVIAPEFFLHPQGNTQPALELAATIAEILAPKKVFTSAKQFAHCAFPERTKFLKQYGSNELSEKLARLPACIDLISWKESLSPQSISLVFSTAYAGNPASMFGHTFLKFNRYSPSDKSKDMLNYTASFGAIYNPNEWTLTYILKGIFKLRI